VNIRQNYWQIWRKTVLTISHWLQWGQQSLSSEFSPELEASILLAHAMQVSPTYLRTWPERLVSDDKAKLFQHYCQRRQTGEPIAYILEEWAFWSLNLRVTPDTLIPRPETEHLVEWVLQHFANEQQLTVADLGTGSGAIALALASEKPQWHIVATDKSAAALAVACENAKRLRIKNIDWRLGAWFEPLAQQRFHCIISNPPYIDPDDVHLTQGGVRFEPISALIANNEGMADLYHLIQQAGSYLHPNGYLVLEHGYQQAEAVTAAMHQHGFVEIKTYCDYAGHQRFTVGQVLLDP
jgi:release factor glutamine methyltransferase